MNVREVRVDQLADQGIHPCMATPIGSYHHTHSVGHITRILQWIALPEVAYSLLGTDRPLQRRWRGMA